MLGLIQNIALLVVFCLIFVLFIGELPVNMHLVIWALVVVNITIAFCSSSCGVGKDSSLEAVVFNQGSPEIVGVSDDGRLQI